MRLLPIIFALMLFAAGCPGTLDFSSIKPSTSTTTVDSSTISAPWPDLGNTSTSDAGAGSTDGVASSDSGVKPDSVVPDSKTAPDTKPLTPDTGTVGAGKPCPCSGGTVCIAGVCRAKCSAPTGACKVTSNCPTNHACLGTTAGYYVCVPAANPGAACGTANYCPINHVCGATGSSAYKCLPICAVSGAGCGTSGGKCVKASTGCMFCSAP
jgi:hypothetical protein